MKLRRNCINYKKYQWPLCGDFKVTATLLGPQQGRFVFFLCECDSGAKTSHYENRDWPSRQLLKPGTKNVQHLQLVESSSILLPPLYIKLGQKKNSVKSIDQTGPALRYLAEKLPGVSAAKINEGVFFGTQTRKLFRDE